MKLTDIFKFKLFERTDPVDMETVNENFESVEKIFDGLTAEDVGAVATKGNTADNTVAFTTASERTKISSGETHATLFGKIARWIADLKTVAFSGNYNDLSNKPTIPTVANNNTTTEAGYALDARQANPNVEGSLGAQISALNSGLMNLIDFASDKTSNTTRYCARFPGGLQICFGIFSNLQTACNKTSGSGYYGWNSDENGLTAFAQPFFDMPVVTVSILGGNSMCIRKINSTKTAITLLEYMSTEPRDLATTVFHYIAIGRWK